MYIFPAQVLIQATAQFSHKNNGLFKPILSTVMVRWQCTISDWPTILAQTGMAHIQIHGLLNTLGFSFDLFHPMVINTSLASTNAWAATQNHLSGTGNFNSPINSPRVSFSTHNTSQFLFLTSDNYITKLKATFNCSTRLTLTREYRYFTVFYSGKYLSAIKMNWRLRNHPHKHFESTA